jgi:AcrR family transcriptional regulator
VNQTTPIPEGATLPDPKTDPRVAEILASVRRAFSEKGFDGASMQDLAKAAGMSVGNFYRYFSSKAGIVAAIIENDLCDIETDFAQVLAAKSPFAQLKALVREQLPRHSANDNSDLWAEISVVARRNSEIGAAAQRMESRIRAALHGVIARETGLSLTEAAHRFAAEADFILLLFKASSCAGDAYSSHQDRLNDLIIHSIDQTLDTISQTARNS